MAEPLNNHFSKHLQRANRYMKKYSASLIIRKIQMKTTMRYHLALFRMALIKKKGDKCWQSCGLLGTLFYSLWKCILVQILWKPVWKFLKKLNTVSILAKNPTSSIYPREMKTGPWRDIYSPMFTAALFTVAKI